MITSTALLVVPVSLICLVLPWRFSVYALVAFAILSDTAVVNLGSFPLLPFIYFGMLMIARFAVELLLMRAPLRRGVAVEVSPLLALLFLNFLVLFLAIVWFYGDVLVVTGTMGFNVELAQPFGLARENFTQIAYLLLYLVLVYVLGHVVAEIGDAAVVDRAVVSALLLAVAVTAWELAWHYGGVWYPHGFFHSDTHSNAWGQAFGSVFRASGPFSEPSALAFMFGGFLLYSWKRYAWSCGSPGLSMALVLVCVAALTLSTSTTAYAMLSLFAAVAAADLISSFWRRRASLSRHSRWTAYGILLAGLIVGVIFLHAHREQVQFVYEEAISGKSETGSFEQRSTVDLMGLGILVDTYGLGLGLGSHKPNSGVVTVLSNLGVLGFVVILIFFYRRLRPLSRWLRDAAPEAIGCHAALRGMLLGVLFGHAFSNPNINAIPVWLASGLLIGLSANPEHVRGRRSKMQHGRLSMRSRNDRISGTASVS